MSKLIRQLMVAASSALLLTSGDAALLFPTLATPNHGHPTTFVGPTVQLGITQSLTDILAYSLDGAVGLRNARVDGTLGWQFDENQRLKVSGEYLLEDISYGFFSGNTNQWVNQVAAGADYQYSLPDVVGLQPKFDLNGYYSHAPSKNLSTVTGTFPDSVGGIQNYVDNRHIAGSNAGGIGPGIIFSFWQGMATGVNFDYDYVRYDEKFASDNVVSGVGGSWFLNQELTEGVNLNLVADVRKPYNSYQAALNWGNTYYFGHWVFGIFGDYTQGKNTLPNTYNLGFSANFVDSTQSAGPPIAVVAPANYKGNYKGDYKGDLKAELPPPPNDFLNWVAISAAYMPQVLAKPDESVTISSPACSLPVPLAVGTIPSLTGGSTIGVPGTTLIATAPFFSGEQIGFSVSVVSLSTPSNIPPNSVSINPLTGQVSVVIGAAGIVGAYELTVTAANTCGSVSQSFEVDYDT